LGNARLSSTDRAAVVAFLRMPPPPGNTDYWNEWHQLCRQLPAGSEDALLEFLVDGSEEQQYAAVLALRAHGIDVVGVGYGSAFYYEVRSGAGETREIRPRVPRTLP
jgi:hypothetical protein